MILSRLVHLVRAGIALAVVVTVLPAAGAESNSCPLYPIALSTQTVAGLAVNAVVTNATFGARVGRFGWLTWAGSPSERALEASLTPPGNSRTYVNPFRRHDHVISIGDSISGRPDLPNSRDLRNALKALTNLTLTVPVWDRIRDKSREGQDDNCDEEHRHHHGCDDRCGDNRRGHDDHDGEGDRVTYRVAGFAAIRILRYDLAGPDRLTFQFMGPVTCEAQNQAPSVQAGGDQTIVFPGPASLAGQVSDDGQPSGATLTQSWMQVNGPGLASFANSNALDTAVSFSTTGVFTLRLTASDTVLTASDDVVVTVNAPNRPPVALDRSLVLAEDTTAAATLLASDPEGSALTYTVTTPPNHGVLTGAPPHLVYVPLADFHGADLFTFKARDGLLDSSNATVSVEITAVNDAPVADALQLTNLEDTVLSVVLSGADVEGSNLTYAITTPPSFGRLGLLATNLITYTPAPDFSGEDSFTYVVSDGELSSSTARVTVLVLPVNDPPRADAGPDQLVDAGATNHLAGSGSDPETAVTGRWTVVSGPGPVNFSDPTALATTVRFDTPGPYLLRLTVGDGALSASDDLQVTVNGPPLVNAGPDLVLATNQAATLAGVVVDDGLPGTLDLAWSQIAGPGAALITSGQAAVAFAHFTAPGDYTLRLAATDTRLVGQDDVRVSVRPAGPNQAPLVHAGSDQSLAYTDRAELRGRLFDDALPWGGARTLLWSVVSPPSAVVSFSCPTCEVTVATFMVSGDYILRLSASDSELAASDEVSISIQLDNLPPVVDAGPDQVVTGAFATLTGAAADDGHPAALVASWMVISGPGAASIADTNHLGTRVAFSHPGTYMLRLVADDGAATASDDVTLTVVGNRAPTAAAGPDQVLDLTVPPALAPPTYSAAPHALGWVADVAQPGWTNLTWGGNSYINAHGLVADGSRLFAACTVPYVNGVDVQGLGSWDGCAWSPLRDPRIPENYWSASGFVTRANTYVLGQWSNRLYLAGSFHYDPAGGPDGVIGSYWDGNHWNAWPFPRLTYPVIGITDLDGTSNGIYVAGSDFSFYPTVTNGHPVGHKVGFWDGTHWRTLGEGITNGYLQTVRAAPNGDVYVGGRFTVSCVDGLARNIARWDGSNWWALAGGVYWSATYAPIVHAIEIEGSNVYVAGSFNTAGGGGAANIARWDGAAWHPLGDGSPGTTMYALKTWHGDLYGGAGGTVGGVGNRIARWDGNQWHALGAGASNGTDFAVFALEALPDGVYAGGEFLTAGGRTALRIAHWGYAVSPTLDGLTNVLVSQSTTGGAAAVVRAQVGHPCGRPLTVQFNVDGGAAEQTNLLAEGATAPAQAVDFPQHYPPGVHAVVVTVDDPATPEAPDVTGTLTVTVLAPAMALLPGVVTDDGLPAGVTGAYWSVLSPPSPVVSFDCATCPVAVATFSQTGTYILALVGSDTELAHTDTVTILVREQGVANRPPTVDAGPDVSILRDGVAALVGTIADDDLPTGSVAAVQWSVLRPPSSVVRFACATCAVTTATFSDPGDYVLRLTADDGQFQTADELTVHVSPQTNAPPTVYAGADRTVMMPDHLPLAGVVSDDGLPNALLTRTWSKVSGPGPVLFTQSGGTNRALFGASGDYVLRLTASDGALSAADDLTLTVFSNSPAPYLAITTPLDSAQITAPVEILGVVTSALPLHHVVQYRLLEAATNWMVCSTGAVAGTYAGALGEFDPSLLLNGLYEVRVVGADAAGRMATSAVVPVAVAGQLKLGPQRVSFRDLSVGLPRFALEVTRSYDSRDARPGDFGVGWTLGLQNVRVQKSRRFDTGWAQQSTGGMLPTYLLRDTQPHVVTLTFPDNRVYRFQAAATPANQFALPIQYGTVVYVPMPGTLGQLESVSGDAFAAVGSIPGVVQLLDLAAVEDGRLNDFEFNPTTFRFTAPDGYVYRVSETAGLEQVTAPNGVHLTFTRTGLVHSAGPAYAFQRDARGFITNATDVLGHAMIYRQDAAGDLVEVVDRDGHTNRFTYDGAHRLLTITDGRGITLASNRYSDAGRLLQVTDASGFVSGYGYDRDGRRQVLTNRLGHVTIHEYDDRGNITRTTDPLGRVASFVYDAQDNLLSATDPSCGCATTYAYDALNNLVALTDAAGATLSYAYNAFGQVVTFTDPEGHTTSNQYDGVGNLIAVQDAAGAVTRFTYNALGLPLTMVDPYGHTNRYAYDAAGFLTNEVDALGHARSYVVDAAGRILEERQTRTVPADLLPAARSAQKAAKGGGSALRADSVSTTCELIGPLYGSEVMVQYQYLPSGQLSTRIFNSCREIHHYNDGSLPERTVDALGHVTETEYDEQGRMVRKRLPDGTEQVWGYDPEGRVTSYRNGLGATTVMERNALGQITTITYPDGTQVHAEYDAQGRLVRELDPSGAEQQYQYDAVGRITNATDQLGCRTAYQFNKNRLCTGVQLPDGSALNFDYDVLNRNTRIAYPDGTERVATFQGRLVTRVQNAAGEAEQFTYDAVGRLASSSNSLGEQTQYEYDEVGHLVAVVDPLGRRTRYDYNDYGWATRVVQSDGTVTETSYDGRGRPVEVRDGLGQVTRLTYDARDRLVALTNALGQAARWTYDAEGQVLSHTDFDGRTTSNEYDVMGRLTRTVFADGAEELFTYNQAGSLLTHRDAAGGLTRYSYDSRQQLVAVINPLGETNSFGYDCRGNRVIARDPLQRTTHFQYDVMNRLVGLTLPDGASSHFGYDPAGRMRSSTDPLGRTTRVDYDAAGRPVQVTDALGQQSLRTYHADGRLATQVDALGRTHRYSYDARGRPTGITQPDGTQRAVEYDPLGRVRARTDEAGRRTTFGYDHLGRLVAVTNALGGVDRIMYDAAGRVAASEDANGHVTGYQYDARGRLAVRVNPDGTTQRWAYDVRGLLVEQTDERSNATHFAYDAGGRLTNRTDALGHATRYRYDAAGQLVATVDALGRETRVEFDPLGRPQRVVHADGTEEAWTMDAAGRVTVQYDQQGHATRYGFDALDRLVAVTNALGGVTRYRYDAGDRLVARVDALGRTNQYGYDLMDRLVVRGLPGGQVESYQYDPVGNLTNRVDFGGAPFGYAYDALDRLVRKTPSPLHHPGQPVVEFGYDPAGLRTQMTDGFGLTTYRYDARDRLVAQVSPLGALDYTYDAAGNVRSILSTNVPGVDLAYSYDALNRVRNVVQGPAGLTQYNYDPVGKVTDHIGPNGVAQVYGHDVMDRVTSVALTYLTNVLAAESYVLDATGRRVAAQELGGRSAWYGYDALYRLTNEVIAGVSAGGQITYTYDAVGNRLARLSTVPAVPSATYAYDVNDRLQAAVHDANGNVRQQVVRDPVAGLGTARTFGYDAEDRLVSITSAARAVVLDYDGDGWRVQKRVWPVGAGTNPVVTRYLMDELNPTGYRQVLAAYDPAQATAFGLGQRVLNQSVGPGGAWSNLFYGTDAHGSVRWGVDGQGQAAGYAVYDAYGLEIAQSGAAGWAHRYVGESYDPDTSLYDLRARQLDVDTGRFLTRDTFEGFLNRPLSQNSYLYGEADPVNRVDPSGHYNLMEMGTVMGLAPMVRQTVLDLSLGVFSSVASVGGGGDRLKALNDAESLHIHGLAQGSGIMMGRANFWNISKGSPFLLAWNPFVAIPARDCFHCEAYGFDPYVPIYGRAAEDPILSFHLRSMREIHAIDRQYWASNHSAGEVAKFLRRKGEETQQILRDARDGSTSAAAIFAIDMFAKFEGALVAAASHDFLEADLQRTEAAFAVTESRGGNAGLAYYLFSATGAYNIRDGLAGSDYVTGESIDGWEMLRRGSSGLLSVSLALNGGEILNRDIGAALSRSSKHRRLAERASVSRGVLDGDVGAKDGIVESSSLRPAQCTSPRPQVGAVPVGTTLPGVRAELQRGADWFDDVARKATRNADSDRVVLGHFSREGASYQKVAAHYKATYFKVDDWSTVTKNLSQDEKWLINETFLTQQLRQGKRVLFSHDPLKARAGSFFEREVTFLRDLGYSFRQKNEWTWEAVK